jgi:hypothetical protein
MLYYRVRNSRGQIAAEVSETGLSVHDQKLSWQLQRLREEGDAPFSVVEPSGGQNWKLEDLLSFFQQNGFTIEVQST